MSRPRPALTSLLLATAVLASGCGGVDIDADEVRSGFADAAEKAYTDDGKSRADDFNNGVRTTCFALDDDAVDEISDALDLESSAALADSAFLSGPAEREMLQCSYAINAEDEAPPIGIVVAVADKDLDEYVETVLSLDEPPTQLDGDSDGLDDDSVTGFARDGFQQAVWSQDGLRVQLGAREQDVDADTLFDALPVVVEEVARVLGS